MVAEVVEHIAQDKGPKPHGLGPHSLGPHAARALRSSLSKSGSIRLKDALMVAHMMQQEASDREVGPALDLRLPDAHDSSAHFASLPKTLVCVHKAACILQNS